MKTICWMQAIGSNKKKKTEEKGLNEEEKEREAEDVNDNDICRCFPSSIVVKFIF